MTAARIPVLLDKKEWDAIISGLVLAVSSDKVFTVEHGQDMKDLAVRVAKMEEIISSVLTQVALAQAKSR